VERKTGKKKRTSFLKIADAVLEDEDFTTKDACIQANLCNCDISDKKMTAVTATKDACEQTNLCCCSETACHVDDMNIAANECTQAHSRVASKPNAAENSHMQQIADEVCIGYQPFANTVVPLTIVSDRMDENNSKEREVVDIDGVCKELEECGLDDTVEYDYILEKSLVVGCNGSITDQMQVPSEANSRGVSKTANTGSYSNESDSMLVSVCDVSLQTSALMNTTDIAVGERPSLENKLYATNSTAKPQPSDIVHSSASLFSDSYRKSVCDASSHNSDKLTDDVFESATPAVVQELDVSQPDSGVMTLHNDMDTSTANAFPQLPDSSEAELTEPSDAVVESCKTTTCTTSSDGDEFIDKALESEFPAEHLLSDEFDVSPRPQDSQNGASQKILTSTAIATPEAIHDIFGLSGSSLSGSNQSHKYGERRKSKHGMRRVSLCGEHE